MSKLGWAGSSGGHGSQDTYALGTEEAVQARLRWLETEIMGLTRRVLELESEAKLDSSGNSNRGNIL